MKVRLNLATSPLDSNRRFTVFASVLGTIGVLALLLLSRHAYVVWQGDRVFRMRQGELQARIDVLSQERRGLAQYFEQPDTVRRSDRAAYLNALIGQRAFPWIKIFTDLEHILPEGVRVVSIEPKLAGDNVQLKLLVGATSDDAKLKFLKTLETSGEFSNIQLLSESRPVRQEHNDQVTLELQAQYSVI
jgi:type IV pilus assembly protein PilN